MKRTILIIIILIILVSCSDTSVHEKLFPSESTEPVLPAEPETQILQISNMAELAAFFSERNTESI
ncbi:MAG: hypothetical protein ACI4NM_11500, partial [Bullifex sp.]